MNKKKEETITDYHGWVDLWSPDLTHLTHGEILRVGEQYNLDRVKMHTTYHSCVWCSRCACLLLSAPFNERKENISK